MASWKKTVNTRLSRLTGYHTLFVPAHGKLSLTQSTDYERTNRLEAVAIRLEKAAKSGTRCPTSCQASRRARVPQRFQ